MFYNDKNMFNNLKIQIHNIHQHNLKKLHNKKYRHRLFSRDHVTLWYPRHDKHYELDVIQLRH